MLLAVAGHLMQLLVNALDRTVQTALLSQTSPNILSWMKKQVIGCPSQFNVLYCAIYNTSLCAQCSYCIDSSSVSLSLPFSLPLFLPPSLCCPLSTLLLLQASVPVVSSLIKPQPSIKSVSLLLSTIRPFLGASSMEEKIFMDLKKVEKWITTQCTSVCTLCLFCNIQRHRFYQEDAMYQNHAPRTCSTWSLFTVLAGMPYQH